MLSTDEMMILLDAFDSWEHINSIISELTCGFGIIDPKYNKIDYLYDLIKSNSRYSSDEDEATDPFNNIIFDTNLSAKQKYDMLV
ncbi:MAG: hypothetical protein K5750_00220 [Eubacterium sp.]|nr:hypothetical protein [Eubacterium sp.]